MSETNYIQYKACPICACEQMHTVWEAKDFTVTSEVFPIAECRQCSLRFTQNVPDEKSIGRYYQSENYISHSETKKGFINWLYHLVRTFTLNQKASLIIKSCGIKNGSILDIGCGTGAFLNGMKKKGWQIKGLEPDAGARAKAKELYSIDALQVNELFAIPENSVDAITLWHVLEHVHSLHAYMQQLKKILKKNGKIFIAVPNYTAYDAAMYKQYWAAYDVPRHLYHFSPEAISELLSVHQLKLIKIWPMWFDSYYVSMLSEKNKYGKNNFVKAYWNGSLSNVKALFDKTKCSSIIYFIER